MPEPPTAGGVQRRDMGAAEPSIVEAFDEACRDHDAGRVDARDAHLAAIRAAAASPADGLRLLGAIALRAGRGDVAIAHVASSDAPAPQTAAQLRDLGQAFVLVGRLDDAARCYREALRRAPDDADTQLRLGDTLLAQDRLHEAVASYRGALACQPDLVAAHANLGTALGRLGYADEAEASHRAALRCAPDLAELHESLGLALLRVGKLDDGWSEYEWRLRAPTASSRFAQPQWAGEPLGDRVLLIHAEQGFGDTIQFCRYVCRIAAAARVVLEVPEPLVRLLAGLPGGAHVVAHGAPLPRFDLHCPMLSLPFVFRTTLETVPNQMPYLAADPARAAAWRERLTPLGGKRVGVVWAGRPTHLADRRRSLSLTSLEPLTDVSGISFVSLQTGPAAAQAQRPPPGMVLHDWTAELGDFAETAALVAGLDLVITVDTAVAHLAGALGRPVWLLNRFDGCWRWLLARDDSPWYPSLRQFRQPHPGDWDAVLRAVTAALADYSRLL
jgi:Flp pilus assembly protein TadD